MNRLPYTAKLLTRTLVTNGVQYKYLTIVLPRDLLNAANLRPEDKLAYRIDNGKVYIRFDQDEGRSSKKGTVSINEHNLPGTLILDQDVVVDLYLQTSELVINIPDNLLITKRGFDLVDVLPLPGFTDLLVSNV